MKLDVSDIHSEVSSSLHPLGSSSSHPTDPALITCVSLHVADYNSLEYNLLRVLYLKEGILDHYYEIWKVYRFPKTGTVYST